MDNEELIEEIAKELYSRLPQFKCGRAIYTWEDIKHKQLYYVAADAILKIIQPRFDEIRELIKEFKIQMALDEYKSVGCVNHMSDIINLCNLDFPKVNSDILKVKKLAFFVARLDTAKTNCPVLAKATVNSWHEADEWHFKNSSLGTGYTKEIHNESEAFVGQSF